MVPQLLSQIKRSRLYIRLRHWEYWPFALIYFPIYPVWLWFAIRSRSLFFFGASNPSIRNGGFLMESKQDIFDTFPNSLMPNTFRLFPGTPIEYVICLFHQQQLAFPVILKPDIGMQGLGVYKIEDEASLRQVLTTITIPYICQPFVPYPKEIGVFFVRHPHFPEGIITGVVEKTFLSVTGDGYHSLRELVAQVDRYRLQVPALERMGGLDIDEVPPPGESRVLVPFGNHARGALFQDVTCQVAPVILSVIQDALAPVMDFNYGRLDIRYNSVAELAENRNWTIIEVNGAGSEPTHMYDPAHSLFFAWREIIRHWNYLYLVAKANKAAGHEGLKFTEGLKMYSDFRAYRKILQGLTI